MSGLITADWLPLDRDAGILFRKFDIYSMDWPPGFDLENVVISASPYGGPIAVVRDRKKLLKVQVSGKPIIYIFSSSGVQISTIPWEGGQLLQLGWSSEEELLCIQDNGSVSIYDMFGHHQHTFSMGKEAEEQRIIDAKVFPSSVGTGIAVITTKFRVYLVNSVKDPKIRQLPKVPFVQPPNSWEVVAFDNKTKVIMSKDEEVFVLEQLEKDPKPWEPTIKNEFSAIIEMSVSLDGRNISLLTDTGVLWIGSSDLSRKYTEVNTNCSSRVKQLIWCGADGVIGNWSDKLLMFGRKGHKIDYSYSYPVYLIPEIDGVRVLSVYNQEMIQKVPKVTQQIFSINSTEPGSYLLEASKQFQKKSHTADEYIHQVRDRLEEAVGQCIKAAGFEFDAAIQKMLMRAAQFGKTYVPDMNPESYVTMCRCLRVLNAVRHPKIGLPLTWLQLNHLGRRILLDRLVVRRHFKLAIEVAKSLRLPEVEGTSRILAHWACYKVKQTHLDQELLAKEMADKLGYAPGVSYSEIANRAIDAGRMQLAIKLLDYEPQTSCQVPLLLRLEQRETALVRALDSGNTDLVYTVILNLRDNNPLDVFQTLIRRYPVAQSLYLKYCKENNPGNMRDMYFQDDDYVNQANCYIQDFSDPKNASPEASLSSAVNCYKKAKNDLLASLCEEHLKLLKEQNILEDKFKKVFVGKTLHDTIDILLSIQEIKYAEKLKNDCKMSDKLFWWLRIQNMAKLGQWLDLDKFSKTKKSPIGYEAFVDVCAANERMDEALKYMAKVKDELKVKYYVKLNMLDEAATTAFEQKDKEALVYVQSNCGVKNESTLARIRTMLGELSRRK